MAGRQFSFFLAPLDQADFDSVLRMSGDIAFLRAKPLSSVPEQIDSSIVSAMGKEALRVLIARRGDLPDIQFSPIRGRPEFSCDVTVAPVVEFDRCYVTDRFIRAGRLYRIDKYWGDDGKLVSKSPEFIEWGERLYKLAKQSLTKVQQGCFAGAEALKLRAAGVAFEGLDIPMGSIKA